MGRVNMLDKTSILRFVQRFPTMPCVKQQSVVEHSFRVAILTHVMFDLMPEKLQTYREEAMIYALTHDLDEAITGDIPSYMKNDEPGDNPVHTIVKVMDRAEALMYAYEEIEMGNHFMAPIKKDLTKKLLISLDALEFIAGESIPQIRHAIFNSMASAKNHNPVYYRRVADGGLSGA